MSGPCVMDGNCTKFYMDGANLRVDLVIDPNPANAASCGIAGLFVPKERCRFASAYSGTPVTDMHGITNGLGSIFVDISAFTGGSPVGYTDITQPVTLTYTNDSGRTEICNYVSSMGQSEYYLRSAWNVRMGIKVSWSGVAGIGDSFGLRGSTGLSTNYLDGPLDVTYPPYHIDNWGEIAPGETLTMQLNMFLYYYAVGAVDANNKLSAIFASNVSIRTWTKG